MLRNVFISLLALLLLPPLLPLSLLLLDVANCFFIEFNVFTWAVDVSRVDVDDEEEEEEDDDDEVIPLILFRYKFELVTLAVLLLLVTRMPLLF